MAYGDATALTVVPWRAQRAPRMPWLRQHPPRDTDAPPAPNAIGDATSLLVIPFRPQARLARWSGLLRNTAQDDSLPSQNFGSVSDYFVQYDARLYSPMSRWCYQMAPAQDTSAPTPPVIELSDATTLTVLPFRPFTRWARPPGLLQNSAQDAAGADTNWGSVSDYYVQYDP